MPGSTCVKVHNRDELPPACQTMLISLPQMLMQIPSLWHDVLCDDLTVGQLDVFLVSTTMEDSSLKLLPEQLTEPGSADLPSRHMVMVTLSRCTQDPVAELFTLQGGAPALPPAASAAAADPFGFADFSHSTAAPSSSVLAVRNVPHVTCSGSHRA